MNPRTNGIAVVLDHNDNLPVGRVIRSWLDKDTHDWMAECMIDESTPRGVRLSNIIKDEICAPLSLKHDARNKIPLHLAIVLGDPARDDAEVIEASQKHKNKRINNYTPNDGKQQPPTFPKLPSMSNNMTDVEYATASQMGKAFENENSPEERAASLDANVKRLRQKESELYEKTGGLAGKQEAEEKPADDVQKLMDIMGQVPEGADRKFLMNFMKNLKTQNNELTGKNTELSTKLGKTSGMLERTKATRRNQFYQKFDAFMKDVNPSAYDEKSGKKLKAQISSGSMDDAIDGEFGRMFLSSVEANRQIIAASRKIMMEGKQRNRGPRSSSSSSSSSSSMSYQDNDYQEFANAFSPSTNMWQNNDSHIIEASASRKRQRTPNDGVFRLPYSHGPSSNEGEMSRLGDLLNGGFDRHAA